MANRRNLLLLLDRPNEPVFMEKLHGRGVSSCFDIPSHYVTERYRPIYEELSKIHCGMVKNRISINSTMTPDLTFPMSLNRNEHFSLMIPLHRRIASSLINTFMGVSI